MMAMVKVRAASNGGIAVCIPSEIRKEMGMELGQQVIMKSDGKKIVIVIAK